jgi:hypothetical protein
MADETKATQPDAAAEEKKETPAKKAPAKKEASVAVADKPAEEKAEPEAPPLTTDVFNNCTSRCSRRAWNVYLSLQNDIEQFKTRLVRGRLTMTNAKAAQEVHKVFVEEAGVTEITTRDNWVEFTASLATVQLVLKRPDTEYFDCLLVR